MAEPIRLLRDAGDFADFHPDRCCTFLRIRSRTAPSPEYFFDSFPLLFFTRFDAATFPVLRGRMVVVLQLSLPKGFALWTPGAFGAPLLTLPKAKRHEEKRMRQVRCGAEQFSKNKRYPLTFSLNPHIPKIAVYDMFTAAERQGIPSPRVSFPPATASV